MTRRRRQHLNSVTSDEKGSPPGMVPVRPAFLHGVEIRGVFMARGKLVLGKVVDGKFVMRPIDRFYRLILWFRITSLRWKIALGIA